MNTDLARLFVGFFMGSCQTGRVLDGIDFYIIEVYEKYQPVGNYGVNGT